MQPIKRSTTDLKKHIKRRTQKSFYDQFYSAMKHGKVTIDVRFNGFKVAYGEIFTFELSPTAEGNVIVKAVVFNPDNPVAVLPNPLST